MCATAVKFVHFMSILKLQRSFCYYNCHFKLYYAFKNDWLAVPDALHK